MICDTILNPSHCSVAGLRMSFKPRYNGILNNTTHWLMFYFNPLPKTKAFQINEHN